MIQASARVTTNKNASAAVGQGVRDALMDAASTGGEVALAHVPHDRGTLSQSYIQPHERSDGAIVWGFGARHAKPVEFGTRPHWPPIENLKGWARRVLGDESAAYAVQRKIAEEGTDPQPYFRKGVDAMKAKLRARGISGYISEVF